MSKDECDETYRECRGGDLETVSKQFTAGAIAGAASRTVTAPMDRIKLVYQITPGQKRMRQVIETLQNEGGLRSFWRGNLINILKTAPKTSIRFGTYDYIKVLYKERVGTEAVSCWTRLVAGSVAGLISQTAIHPLEVVKTKLTLAHTGKYNGIVDCIIKNYRSEGLLFFTKGYIPTTIVIIPHSGLDLTLYETLKELLQDCKGGGNLTSFDFFQISSLSCLVGQTLAYPFQMVSTIMQNATRINNGFKLTMTQHFQIIWKQEGFKGLFRGIGPHFLKFIPVTGVTFVVYEFVSDLLGISMA